MSDDDAGAGAGRGRGAAARDGREPAERAEGAAGRGRALAPRAGRVVRARGARPPDRGRAARLRRTASGSCSSGTGRTFQTWDPAEVARTRDGTASATRPRCWPSSVSCARESVALIGRIGPADLAPRRRAPERRPPDDRRPAPGVGPPRPEPRQADLHERPAVRLAAHGQLPAVHRLTEGVAAVSDLPGRRPRPPRRSAG